MATIVKPPKPRRVQCSECKATIEYMPEELQVRQWKDYGGFSNREEYVPCPRPGCPGEGVVSSS